MPSTIRYGLLAVLCLAATLAHALTAQVSETFPLADTVYGQAFGPGKLRTDGRNGFLFWLDEDQDRLSVSRIDAEERVAKLVFPFSVFGEQAFDAVWTGSHFLVVAQNPGYELIGQLIDTSGDPVGRPITLAQSALWPRLAFNGRNVLLLYAGDGVETRLLTPAGIPAGEPNQLGYPLLTSSELHLASNGTTFAAIVPADAYTAQALFVFDAQGNVTARQTLDTPRAEWALTSNGSRYLGVASYFTSYAVAHVFEGDGTLIARVDLHPTAGFQRFYRHPSAIWTGTRWLVALYVENGMFTRLLEIDSNFQLETRGERPGAASMELATAGGELLATWHDHTMGIVAGPPLGEGARRVLFAARHQTLVATATSAAATLFVWHDLEAGRGALRAGLRTHDGRWSERELTTASGNAVAASDGNGFVVVTRFGPSGNQLIRLDGNGNPIPGGTQPFTAFEPLAIASNGSGYAVVGSTLDSFVPTGNLLAAEITGSGVSPAREIPFRADDVVDVDLASDGQRYLVAWGVEEDCSPSRIFCGAERIAGVFLTANATVDGPLLRLTEDEPLGELELEWNGSEYVLARNAGGVTASHVSRTGAARDRHVLTTEFASNLSLVGETVAWTASQSVRMAAIGDPQPLTIDTDPRNFPWWHGRLVSIGNGRFAYAFSTAHDAAPIHGRRHVMAKIIAPSLPPLPAAPVLSILRLGATVALQWTATGDIDGFRVEQRIGDGPWVEVGGWRDTDERHLVVRTLASPQFRVRAFNEAGAGPYAGPARRRPTR